MVTPVKQPFMAFLQTIKLALVLWCLSCTPAWAFTELQATVSENPVSMGQSFELTITANAFTDAHLDLTPLEHDFNVRRANISRSQKNINFRSISETRWQIVLMPKHEGNVLIPALTINGISSNPINLAVIGQGQNQGYNTAPVQLTVEVDNNDLWVGQATTLRVTLSISGDLQEGALIPPEQEDFTLQQLGQDQNKNEIINGRRVHVITRNYLLIPEKSGELALNPVVFEGQLFIGGSRDSFFSSPQTRSYMAESQPLTFQVKPQPSSYQGHWLTADAVTLSMQELASNEITAGQPLTLDFTLLATGNVGAALPEIRLPAISGVRIYPDKAQRSEGLNQNQLTAQLTQAIAIVPQQAGEFTIPAIRIPWWNVQRAQQEWATLPAQTITVLANPHQTAEALTLPSQGTATSQPQINSTSSNSTTSADHPHLIWWQLSSVCWALLWLVTLWWGWRRQTPLPVADAPAHSAVVSSLLPQLIQACRHNQAAQALNILPQWASQYLSRPISLAELPQYLPSLAEPLHQLQQSRYSQDQQQWQGHALAEALSALPQEYANSGINQLAPLNPN
ncbi:MAG: BatD family protein [Ferrimonas sp.]